MLFIVAIVLVFMITKTTMALANKELMKEYNENGVFGVLLILGLIAEISGLIWTIKYYFSN